MNYKRPPATTCWHWPRLQFAWEQLKANACHCQPHNRCHHRQPHNNEHTVPTQKAHGDPFSAPSLVPTPPHPNGKHETLMIPPPLCVEVPGIQPLVSHQTLMSGVTYFHELWKILYQGNQSWSRYNWTGLRRHKNRLIMKCVTGFIGWHCAELGWLDVTWSETIICVHTDICNVNCLYNVYIWYWLTLRWGWVGWVS